MTQQSYHIQELNLVFIDPTVLNSQSLIASVKPDHQVVILDFTKDGVTQIGEFLETNSFLQQGGLIKSIHLVSHGIKGGLQLGSTLLNSKTLKSYEKDLQHWKKALSDGTDLVVYGCDVAFGDEGKTFIQQLSQLTGTDVTASDDLTGNSTLGGDWNLEVATGLIEASLAFSSQAMEAYGEVLSQFVVTNTNDSGVGSLRQAILNSNSTPGTQDILFSLPTASVVNLASALPNLTDSVNIINFTGAKNLTIRRNSGGNYSIFTIKNGQTVNIEGLTLTNGSSEFGGGIYNEGTLAIANSIISGNQATQTGGGIYNKGTLTVTNSTINGNTAQIVGGGIGAATGFSIANSTISGNTAKFGGGAIGDVIATGTVNISNTTIYNNFSNAGGGGIDLITLTVNIKNSILAGNKNDDGEQNFASPGDGKIISFGHNIESGTDAGFTSTGDLQNTNPLLAPLADNGGFTPTHALLPGSPAINKGDNTNALTLDQRGNPRIIDGTVDIGAFEVNPYPPKVSFGAAQYNKVEGNSDTTVTIPVTLDSLPSTTVTVPITISLTSTATSGSDYFFAPTTLSFNPGVTGTGLTQQLSITIKADNLPENDETIVFNFGTIQGAVAGTINTTTLTIAANDASPDTLIGTNGSDEIFGLSSNDIVIGKLGSDTIDAGEGEDTVFGDEITPIVDILGENNDTIRGGNGADRIFGGEGDDKLYGDAGNDMIWGNDGSDFLWGGEGNDYLTGGQGNDVFVVSSNGGIDTINDFQEYDTIGLIGGLTYSQLSITQILNNTFIFESSSQKILAILTGVQASTLTSSRFQNLTVDV